MKHDYPAEKILAEVTRQSEHAGKVAPEHAIKCCRQCQQDIRVDQPDRGIGRASTI